MHWLEQFSNIFQFCKQLICKKYRSIIFHVNIETLSTGLVIHCTMMSKRSSEVFSTHWLEKLIKDTSILYHVWKYNLLRNFNISKWNLTNMIHAVYDCIFVEVSNYISKKKLWKFFHASKFWNNVIMSYLYRFCVQE